MQVEVLPTHGRAGGNRVGQLPLPAERCPVLVPSYNRAGALVQVRLNSEVRIRQLACNTCSQRLLLARGNRLMARYAYDAVSFRLQRLRTEAYAASGETLTPQSGTGHQDTAYGYDPTGNPAVTTEYQRRGTRPALPQARRAAPSRNGCCFSTRTRACRTRPAIAWAYLKATLSPLSKTPPRGQPSSAKAGQAPALTGGGTSLGGLVGRGVAALAGKRYGVRLASKNSPGCGGSLA